MSTPRKKSTAPADASLCRRALVLSTGFVALFSLLGWRLVNLHVFQRDTFVRVAEAERLRKVDLPAPRGTIVDSRGEILAIDRPSYSVIADRNLLRDLNLALRTLSEEEGRTTPQLLRSYSAGELRERSAQRVMRLVAPRLGMSEKELLEAIGDKPTGEVVLRKDLGDEAAQNLRDFLESGQLPGIFVREGVKRFYPHPDRAVHVVGFADAANNGIEGIERSMDDELRGQPGWRWLERDRLGRESRSTARESRDPVGGRHVRLTLDLDIQEILEREMDATGTDEGEVYLPPLKAESATVILMDPKTGSVLALANRPQHTLDKRDTLTSNAAIFETYEPGSTFKIAAYTGAFDRQLVSLTTWLNLSGGYYQRGDIVIRDDHPLDGGTVLTAFSHSSNIGAFLVAQQLGAARFHGYIRAFGFGSKTGIDLPGESTGLVRSLDQWKPVSLPSVARGYEVSTTPLQVLNATVALLNDGKLRRPRLVSALLADDNSVVREFPPEEGTKVCSPAAARAVRRMMLDVVKKGTAKQAAIPGYEVGGKTGTSEKYDPKLRAYAKGAYFVSFVGYVQSTQGPELAGIVVIDDPKVEANREYGGQLAAPLFRRIAERVLQHRGIAPDPGLLAGDAETRTGRR